MTARAQTFGSPDMLRNGGRARSNVHALRAGHNSRRAALAVTMISSCFLALAGENGACSGSSLSHLRLSPADQPKEDAESFVREVLQHEVEAQIRDEALWSYHKLEVENGEQKLYCVYQTQQGEIDRLVAVDGKPLEAGQIGAEDARIEKLVAHPKLVRQEEKKRRADGERARDLLKMFPDAFRFQYDGNEGQLVKLRFAPNPKFRAEGHAAQVFHHMEGTLVLDEVHKRLVAIDGRLTSEVKFGGGLFGHLDPGGLFSVRQEEVIPGYWEVTQIRVEMAGKALFFKTIGVHQDERDSDFKPVPNNMTLQQAAELVRSSANGL